MPRRNHPTGRRRRRPEQVASVRHRRDSYEDAALALVQTGRCSPLILESLSALNKLNAARP